MFGAASLFGQTWWVVPFSMFGFVQICFGYCCRRILPCSLFLSLSLSLILFFVFFFRLCTLFLSVLLFLSPNRNTRSWNYFVQCFLYPAYKQRPPKPLKKGPPISQSPTASDKKSLQFAPVICSWWSWVLTPDFYCSCPTWVQIQI